METKIRATRHVLAFWFGVIYILAGVSCHLPDLIKRHFHFGGLPLTNMMLFGMFLILASMLRPQGLLGRKSEMQLRT